jgi:DNA-binding response OmpR family regulator
MKKVMVVDDDKDLLQALKGILKREGYDVSVTTSCNEGLDILIYFKPDLIFLDINVGSDDGRETCRRIKSMAEHKHIPIILMSANDDALKTYKEYGADSSMTKPLQIAHLLKMTRIHLSPPA